MSGHRHSHNSSRSRDIISLFCGFLLALLTTILVVFSTVRIGILSPRGFISILDTEYYESVLSYTNEKLVSCAYPTGIDPRVTEGVVTIEDVERDVAGIISASFTGTEYEPELTDINARLIANVSSFLLEGSVELEGKPNDTVASFSREMDDAYLQAMKMPKLELFVKLRSEYLELLSMAIVVCAILAGVLIVVIYGLHHFPHRGLRFISYATGGASLMCLVGPLALLLVRPYDRLNLEPRHLYHFGVKAISHALSLIVVGGLVLAAVTILLAVLVSRMRDGVIHSHSHRKRSHSE